MDIGQRRLATGTAFLVLMGIAIDARASSQEEDVATTILSLDRQFWNAYNACDTEAQRQYFTDDVEFYHDKGGPTFGADALIESTRKNLCSGSTRVRREAIRRAFVEPVVAGSPPRRCRRTNPGWRQEP